MYISVREYGLSNVFGSIKAALDAMRIDSVELEYFRDCAVMSPDSTDGARDSLADAGAIDAFAKKCAGLNLRVSALLMHNNFAAEDLDAEIEWAVSCIEAAAQLGLKSVRIDAAMHAQTEWSLDRCIQRFAESMARVLDATTNLAVDMGIENHGHQGNRPEFLDEVFAKVDSLRLGLTLDTANFYWYGHPLSKVHEIIERFAQKVKHTHIKNINFPKDIRETRREIGWEYNTYASSLREGDIDLEWTVKVLRDAGYSNRLCIEDESLGRRGIEERKAVLIDDADYMREVLGAI